jgi:FMN phosphatase YigB (HAD superfamily)
MNREQWLSFLDRFDDKRGAIHKDRNHRYAHDIDVLANFKRNAYGRTTSLEVWRTYAGKHWDSICSLIDDLSNGKSVSPALGESDILGSFYDLANYLELGAALVEESMSNDGTEEPKQREELPLILIDVDDTLWDFVGKVKSVVGEIPEQYLMTWGGLSDFLGDSTPRVFQEAANGMQYHSPFLGAVGAIERLYENHRIGIVTSRHHGHLDGIISWLENWAVPSDFVLTGQQDKTSVARGLKAVAIIDDNLDTLVESSESGIRACGLARSWNAGMSSDDTYMLTLVESWDDIEDWIHNGKR